MDVYCDVGFSRIQAELEGQYVPLFIQNSYNYDEFNVNVYNVPTHLPTSTPCRSPTSCQTHAFAENLMDQVGVAGLILGV